MVSAIDSFKNFINNNITAVYISTILGLVIPYLKNKYDIEKNLNSLIVDKLEKVYSPLMFDSSIEEEDYLFTKDNFIKNILVKHSHLLSLKLNKYIVKEMELEKQFLENKSTEIYEEHKSLKKKIISTIKIEFYELHKLYDKIFITHKNKTHKSLLQKSMDFIVVFSISFSIYFFILIVYSTFTKDNNSKDLDYTLFMLSSYIFVFTIIGILTALITVVTGFIFKISNIYSNNDDVPVSGLYKCLNCGKNIFFYKYDEFPECTNRFKIFPKFLPTIYIKLRKKADKSLESPINKEVC